MIHGGAHDNQQESPQLSSCKEQHDRTGRPVVPFLHTTSDVSTFKNFFSLLQLDRLQLTVVCCNRREGVNTTPHTSYFLTDSHAHAWLKMRVCCPHITCHVSSSCGCFDLTLFDYSTFLSSLTIFSLIILSFLLPVGGQIPCAPPLLRTLTLLPSTTLSQVMSPTKAMIREMGICRVI